MALFGTAAVGMEIGKRTIKAAAGPQSKNGRHMKAALIEETPPSVFKSDDSLDPEVAGDVLKKIFQDNGLNRSRVQIALNTDKAIVRERRLPKARLKELAAMARFEIQPFLPGDLEEFIVDFRILEIMDGGNGEGALRILIAAIPKSLAESYMETARRGGLKIRSIRIYSDCLDRFMNHFNPFPKENLLVADIGAQSTRLTLFRKGSYFASFTSELGGVAATRMLAVQTGLPFSDAEALKISKGFALPDACHDKTFLEKLDPAPFPMMNPYCDALAGELSKVADFFRTRRFSGMVDRVLLAGGGSGIANMDAYLQNRTGLKVAQLDKALSPIQSEGQKQLPEEAYRRLLPAIGAAYGSWRP